MNTLHIVMGAPAAGKTTFGRKLAEKYDAAFLDIDTVTEPVVRAGLKLAGQNPDDRDSPVFKTAFRDPIYDSLFAIAKDNLSHVDVVIVGPFTQEARDAGWLERLRKELGTEEVRGYFITCAPATRRLRMMKRENPRDLAKLADWESYIQYHSGEQPPSFPHEFIDTSSGSS